MIPRGDFFCEKARVELGEGGHVSEEIVMLAQDGDTITLHSHRGDRTEELVIEHVFT